MRIISKFSDYYDSGMKYGTDPNILYVREMVEHKRTWRKSCEYDEAHAVVTKVLDAGEARDRWHNYNIGGRFTERTIVVVFCGKIYPCLELSVEEKTFPCVTKHTHYCYTFSQVEVIYKENLSKKDLKSFYEPRTRKRRWRRWKRETFIESLRKFFALSGTSDNNLMDFHHAKEVPVMMLAFDHRVVYNPCLKDVQFFRIMDNYTAYQELAMFIGGVLGGKSPKTIEVSNDIKIAKRGFDKWSFRKEPEK
jgi:hypothetical protein